MHEEETPGLLKPRAECFPTHTSKEICIIPKTHNQQKYSQQNMLLLFTFPSDTLDSEKFGNVVGKWQVLSFTRKMH